MKWKLKQKNCNIIFSKGDAKQNNFRTMFPLYQSLYKHLPPPPIPSSMSEHLSGNPDGPKIPCSVSGGYDTSNIFAAAVAWHHQTLLRTNSSPNILGSNYTFHLHGSKFTKLLTKIHKIFRNVGPLNLEIIMTKDSFWSRF